jgi:hypothetical protein
MLIVVPGRDRTERDAALVRARGIDARLLKDTRNQDDVMRWAGVGQFGAGLMSGNQLAASFPSSPPSTNMALWYRADFNHLTSGKVDTLIDQSTNTNNAVQATGANQPTYNASDAGYNNKPTMSFAGGQILASGNTAYLTQPGTVYVVGENTSTSGAMYDGNSGTDRWVLLNNGSSVPEIYAGTGPLVCSGTINVKCVQWAIFNGASSSFGVSAVTANTTGNAGSGSMRFGVTIGAYTASSEQLTGKIAELIYYTAVHNATDRTNTQAYFNGRYTISIGG